MKYLSLFLVPLLGADLLHCLVYAQNQRDIPGGSIYEYKAGRTQSSGFSLNSDSSSNSNAFSLPNYNQLGSPDSGLLPRWLPRDNILEKRQTLNPRQSICTFGGTACGSSRWCYNGLGCCKNNQMGCDNQACCNVGETCCTGAGVCCPKGYACFTTNNNRRGCCKVGSDCLFDGATIDTDQGVPDGDESDQCVDKGYGLCKGGRFCCPTNSRCLLDSSRNPSCQASCQNSDWKLCPTNDFCCPQNAQCYQDSRGEKRCRVFITTTIFATSPPEATSSSVVETSATTEETTTTSSSESESISESAIEATSISTSTDLRDQTVTVWPSSTNAASASAASKAAAEAEARTTVHRGGLDDIFTNSASNRQLSIIWPICLWICVLLWI